MAPAIGISNEHANVLRVMIGDYGKAAESTTVAVLEANIDDSSRKFWLCHGAPAGGRGARRDATPCMMKKSRPGTCCA